MIRHRLIDGIGARCSRIFLAAATSLSLGATAFAESDWVGPSGVGCGTGCGPGYGIGCTEDNCTDLAAPVTTEPIYSPSPNPIQESPAYSQPATTPSNAFSSGTPQGFPSSTPSGSNIFSGGVEGTLTAQAHAPGYIDNALPQSQFRIRFDGGWNNVTPDRAEFFYAQCGCAGGPGPGDPNTGTINGRVDYQDIRAYLEIATGNRSSIFGEIPIRFIQGVGPLDNRGNGTGTASGLGDIDLGFKYALTTDPNDILTFQLRAYLPTGDADRGLGTQNVNLEPALLWRSRVSNRVTVFGELRDWIPIQGSKFNGQNFAGNVLRYGLGVGVTAYEDCNLQVSPITELVGWSVLDGLVNDAAVTAGGLGLGNPPVSAKTTIVNAKFGLRTIFKRNGSSLYFGYGRALTGTHWYQDIARVDYTVYY
ncbi:MAG: transporter [Planctomycetaceae bacterium]